MMPVDSVFAMEQHLVKGVNVIIWKTSAPEELTQLLESRKSAQVSSQ